MLLTKFSDLEKCWTPGDNPAISDTPNSDCTTTDVFCHQYKQSFYPKKPFLLTAQNNKQFRMH